MTSPNPKTLANATRNFMVAFDRFMASSTQGRLKEMNAARIPLNAELAKWEIEYTPVRDGVTGRLF